MSAFDTQAKGIVAEIQDILRNRISLLGCLVGPKPYFLCLASLVVGIWFVPLNYPPPLTEPIGIIGIFLVVLGVGGMVWNYWLSMKRYSIVYFHEKATKNNIFFQNKDKIWQLILVIFGGVVGFYVKELLEGSSR